jgi:hypothetical protein
MRFPYLTLRTHRPVYSLGGSTTRFAPVFSVGVDGPLGTYAIDCRLDSGADDTVFPLRVARTVGIVLTGAPIGESQVTGGAVLSYQYFRVTLRVSDAVEACVWPAIVGFVDAPMRFGLLGIAGFLDYFDATLLGAAREVVLSPNASFPGQHIIY